MPLNLENFKHPYLATDIVIEYQDKRKSGIILIQRRNPPLGLAIPGGFAEYKLSLEENAVKEAKEETGLDVTIENPEHPLCILSSPNRDPRAHIIAVVYIAKGFGILKAGDDAKSASLYSIEEIENLLQRNSFVMDHNKIIGEYLKYLGIKNLA